jgi:hypothetical protein
MQPTSDNQSLPAFSDSFAIPDPIRMLERPAHRLTFTPFTRSPYAKPLLVGYADELREQRFSFLKTLRLALL